MKLRSPERLFGLDEEIDNRLPHVRSLRLIREKDMEVGLNVLLCK